MLRNCGQNRRFENKTPENKAPMAGLVISRRAKGVSTESSGFSEKAGRDMAPSSGTTAFAIKASYYVIGAVVIVFIAMLALTVMHP